MTNTEIAAVFQDIADLLERKKDSRFKIRAYQRTADYIKDWPVEMKQLTREGRLKEIPGVREATTKKITKLVASGRLEYYEKFKAEFTEVKK